MFHNWLDNWDERQARNGEAGKHLADFSLGAQLAFPGARGINAIEDFCAIADQAVRNPHFFEQPDQGDPGIVYDDGWVRFPSSITTDIDVNNKVTAKVTDGSSLDRVLVVFHHWNAGARQRQLAWFFSRCGITVVEMALPYHLERRRPGSAHADYMISPNLGRTIQSMRQGVLDGRRLIAWLKSEGYREISVLGLSLGSMIAGLVAAHEPNVSKASLFLAAGNLADMVWTGRATRAIRESLEPSIDLPGLRRAWSPLNLENYGDRLARPELDLQIVLAERDKVILPDISDSFVHSLFDAGAVPEILKLNCGHYSLTLPPYIFRAGWGLKRFLMAGDLGKVALETR